MKFITLLTAAGVAAASLAVPAAAEAQRWNGDRVHGNRGWHGDHRGYNRWDRRDRWRSGYRYGPRYAYRNHGRCWTEWRHHRAFRVCR